MAMMRKKVPYRTYHINACFIKSQFACLEWQIHRAIDIEPCDDNSQ